MTLQRDQSTNTKGMLAMYCVVSLCISYLYKYDLRVIYLVLLVPGCNECVWRVFSVVFVGGGCDVVFYMRYSRILN